GVMAIRHQRRTGNLAADADAEYGDCLVAQKTDHAGGHDPPELADRLWVDQPVDRLVSSNDAAEQDDEDDQHAREVLNPAKAIIERPGGWTAHKLEGDPQRDRRGGIADVVDRVGQ